MKAIAQWRDANQILTMLLKDNDVNKEWDGKSAIGLACAPDLPSGWCLSITVELGMELERGKRGEERRGRMRWRWLIPRIVARGFIALQWRLIGRGRSRGGILVRGRIMGGRLVFGGVKLDVGTKRRASE